MLNVLSIFQNLTSYEIINVEHLILVLYGFIGLCISIYIYIKKRHNQTITCPLNGSCHTVIYSKYSKFLKVPVEILGIIFYSIIVVAYSLLLLNNSLATVSTQGILFALSTLAFFFSLYLITIQFFTIREVCTWCISSALLCTFIFIYSVISVSNDTVFVTFFQESRKVYLGLHIIAIALGLGGATFNDIFFFKFLKDFQIDEQEAGILHTFSEIIWLSIGLFIVSGIALYIPNSQILMETPKFLVKLISFTVVVINGFYFNLLIGPRLTETFIGKQSLEHHQINYYRKFAFAQGAISMISWYTTFILGLVDKKIPFSFIQILGTYIFLLIGGVIVSQIMEILYARRITSTSSTTPSSSPTVI